MQFLVKDNFEGRVKANVVRW